MTNILLKMTGVLLLAALCTACNGRPADGNSTEQAQEPAELSPELLSEEARDTVVSETSIYHIVIAEEGTDYYTLRKRMTDLAAKTGIPVDTMGRGYHPGKKLIALPEDDEDEMYAGEYYPRRFPSESFSIEYLHIFQEVPAHGTMVLVAGIYERAAQADSALSVIKQLAPAAYRHLAEVYTGCMH